MKPIFVSLLLTLLIVSIPVTAQNEPLQIVASHSILGDVVSNVIGDATDLSVTMPAGADPHSFEPVPSDLVALANADVVFINGAFFEEGLLEAIENASTDMNIVTASSCIEVISFSHDSHDHDDDEHHDEDEDHDEGEDHDEEHHDDDGEMSANSELCEQHDSEMEAMHEEGEDHDHEHSDSESLGRLDAADCGEESHSEDEESHEEGEEHAHEEGACDPHVWMNPHNVMLWTMLIRDTVIELDPDNAAVYTANAEAYILALDELMHDFIEPMVETVPEENRILVTSHDSLGYFAARFNFEIVTTIIPSGSTLAEPSAADVVEVIDLIRDSGVPAIFGETTVNDAVAQQIANETGAELAILYSGSLSDEDSPANTYLNYMRYNVTTIVEALGGGR